jgi:ketosteroid isomerase-like protein
VTRSANLDLVRSIFAPWERGDFSAAGWMHPEIELVFADGPTPGSWTGPAGIGEGLRESLTAFRDFRIEADEYRELDDERVLVYVHWGGRGRASGVELDQMSTRGAHLFQVRGREVTRLVVYYDRERAFADLDLPPQTGPRAT